MKKDEVPQDQAILGPWQELFYAVDEDGRYVLAPSRGWEAATVANLQAWEVIAEEMEQALSAVRAGRASPLAFHMARCQMNPRLLSRYVGIGWWRVRRHLRPAGYAAMGSDLRERYARIFGIEAAELDRLPEQVQLPVPRVDEL
ncbi:MAG: hypothetical protein JXB25_05230 [Deltaproteobacteria bacterium]|nr:hypothetical protein [Deltaproteobacteria bacterium]